MHLPPLVLELLLKTTLLLALTCLALLLGRRLSASLRHLAATVGLLAALLLPALAVVMPSIRIPALAGLLPSREAVQDAGGDPRPPVLLRSERPRTGESWRAVPAGPLEASPRPAPRWSLPVDLVAVLAVVWSAGAVVVVSGALAGSLRVRQIVKRATPVSDPDWLSAAAELAAAVGLGARRARRLRLLHTEELAVPLAAGVLRPAILLPEEARAWNDERRRIVLLHELAHVARRDCLSLIVASLAASLHWFHPLVWLLARRIREEGEKAADDLVLSAGVRASSYAGELLSFVRSLRFVEDEALPAMALAEGSHLSRRLRAVLDPARRRTVLSPTALRAAVAVLLAATATLAAVEPGRPGAAPSPSGSVVFASKRAPRGGADWYGRGMDLHNDGRYDEAIAAFQKAIELGHKEDAAAYNIACGYALKGDPDHAFEWLRRALDEGFDLASYMSHDDDLDSLRSDRRWADLKREARRGSHHEKEAAKAVERLQGLMSRPEGGEALFQQGSKLLHLDEYERAAAAFQAAAERGYRPGTALYNQACALSLGGRKAEAIDALAKSLEAGYDDPGHMDRDDDLDAIRHEPRYRELREVADDLELDTGGGDFFTKWMSGRPSSRQVREWRASIERYHHHLASHPSCGRAEFNLGFVYLKLEKPAEARIAFQKALEAGYRKPTTLYNLACASARAGDKDAALDWLGKAVAAGFDGESMARSDEDLDSLRGDARFRKLLREMREREHRADENG